MSVSALWVYTLLTLAVSIGRDSVGRISQVGRIGLSQLVLDQLVDGDSSRFLIETLSGVAPFTHVAHNRKLSVSDAFSPARNTLFG